MKFNIAQFSFGDGFAGSAKMAILSSQSLLKSGHVVKLYVSKDSLTKKRALERGIPIIELDSKLKRSMLIENVFESLKNDKFDFAVAYHSLDRKVVMKLKSRLKREIISVGYRQNMSLSTPIIGSFIYNRYFDYMIGCSQGVANSLIKEGIKRDKVYVLHNTTEIPENLSILSGNKIRVKFDLKEKIVLGISSWFHKERKGFDILFEAFSKLDDRFVLLIIGIPEEHQNEVIEYAQSFKITSDKIIMPGFIDNVFEYYKAMDIFLLPSRSEGFSLALLEAAASGLPIIASDIPGNDEFIEDQKNGLLFDISEPEELKNKIIELAGKASIAAKYAEEANASFENEFTPERYAEKLNNFLDVAYSTFNKTNSSR